MSNRKQEHAARAGLAAWSKIEKTQAKSIKDKEKQIAEYEAKAKQATTESAKKTYLGLASHHRKTLASYKEKLAGIAKDNDAEGLKSKLRSRLQLAIRR